MYFVCWCRFACTKQVDVGNPHLLVHSQWWFVGRQTLSGQSTLWYGYCCSVRAIILGKPSAVQWTVTSMGLEVKTWGSNWTWIIELKSQIFIWLPLIVLKVLIKAQIAKLLSVAQEAYKSCSGCCLWTSCWSASSPSCLQSSPWNCNWGYGIFTALFNLIFYGPCIS